MKKILTEAFSVNLIIVIMLLMLGTVSAKTQYSPVYAQEKPIYKADCQDKKIALMVNVYQGTEFVMQYAKFLKEKNISATFFIGGIYAEKNSETIKYLFDNGFEIGNHGYNHKLHTKLSKQDSANEISRTNTLLKSITGQKPTLFAPPSGDVDSSLVSIAKQQGCLTIMWTADTIDWRDQDKQKICARVKRNLTPGALILTHPTKATVEALEEIVSFAQSEGYTFCEVGELLK